MESPPLEPISRRETLRQEIKEWERTIRLKKGATPTRDDIKNDPSIQSKYKEYEQLSHKDKERERVKNRDVRSRRSTDRNISDELQPQKDRDTPRKRKSIHQSSSSTPKRPRSEPAAGEQDNHVHATPSRPSKNLDRRNSPKPKAADQPIGSTPQRRRPLSNATLQTMTPMKSLEQENPVQATPESIRRLMMMGPTPQKNGMPLGIFDDIPKYLLAMSPSTAREALKETNANSSARASPLKVIPNTPLSQRGNRAKFSRTPMSEGRRFMLDKIVTPAFRKQGLFEVQDKTPSDHPSLRTPAFLRRYKEPDPEMLATPRPIHPVPWKRPQFGRSLSTMIAENKQRQQQERQVEEDALDADLDLLNQLENEGQAAPKPKSRPLEFADIVPLKETGQSQTLDRDGFAPSTFEHEFNAIEAAEAEEAEKNGVPRKQFKKKGLKRQTKRHNMRPVRNKPKTAMQPQQHDDDSSSDDDLKGVTRIPETQLDDDFSDEDLFTLDPTFDPSALGDDTAPKLPSKPIEKTTSASKNATAAKANKSAKEPAKKKQVDRNNYVKLKIKNKNSKANGRKFGRRR